MQGYGSAHFIVWFAISDAKKTGKVEGLGNRRNEGYSTSDRVHNDIKDELEVKILQPQVVITRRTGGIMSCIRLQI